MTPRGRYTPRRHGASHKGDGIGAHPRVCAAGPDCLFDGRVQISKDIALWLEQDADGVRRSWHFRCHPLVRGV